MAANEAALGVAQPSFGVGARAARDRSAARALRARASSRIDDPSSESAPAPAYPAAASRAATIASSPSGLSASKPRSSSRAASGGSRRCGGEGARPGRRTIRRRTRPGALHAPQIEDVRERVFAPTHLPPQLRELVDDAARLERQRQQLLPQLGDLLHQLRLSAPREPRVVGERRERHVAVERGRTARRKAALIAALRPRPKVGSRLAARRSIRRETERCCARAPDRPREPTTDVPMARGPHKGDIVRHREKPARIVVVIVHDRFEQGLTQRRLSRAALPLAAHASGEDPTGAPDARLDLQEVMRDGPMRIAPAP